MNTRASDRRRLPHGALLVVLLGLFTIPKVLQHTSFHTLTHDTGIYSNLVWNLAHGEGFHSDVLQRNHLGEHFSPILVLLAPLYRLWPDARVLLAAQGACVALTLWLFVRFCETVLADLPVPRRRLLTVIALGLALVYRPILAAWGFQFQPIVLGMPLTMGALLALHHRRMVALAACTALLLLTRESAAVTVIGLGLYAGLVLGRRRVLWTMLGVGVAAGLLTMALIMPAFRDQAWQHYDRVAPFADAPAKAAYVLQLLGWQLFLPLWGWRAAIAATPGVLLNLVTGHANQYSLNFHYDAQLAVFLLAGGAFGLRRISERYDAMRSPAVRRRLWATLVAAATLAVVAAVSLATLTSRQKHSIVRKVATKGRELFVLTPQRAVVAAHLASLELGPDVPVAADTYLTPHVCNRRTFFTLEHAVASALPPGTVVLVSDLSDTAALRRRLEARPDLRLHSRSEHLAVFIATVAADND